MRRLRVNAKWAVSRGKARLAKATEAVKNSYAKVQKGLQQTVKQSVAAAKKGYTNVKSRVQKATQNLSSLAKTALTQANSRVKSAYNMIRTRL